MKTISKKQLDRLGSDVKPTDGTLRTRREKQVASDMATTAREMKGASSAIMSAGTIISKSVLELVTSVAKDREPVEEKKKQWEFTMHRDANGFLSNITAVEL
jgi:hypothetical protein